MKIKKKSSREDYIIDSYYKEASNISEASTESDDFFKSKLENALTKMNAAEDMNFHMDINILGIINKAEAIKDRRKLRVEGTCFIALCILIISSLVFLSMSIDIKIVILIEAATSVFLPLTLIPVALNTKVRGNAK